MRMYEEKRQYRRIKVSLPLEISNLKKGAALPPGSSRSGDISEGGVSSRVPCFVQMSQGLVIEMHIPGAVLSARAIAKVAWIKKPLEGDGYKVGLQFLEAGREDRQTLKKYVSEAVSA